MRTPLPHPAPDERGFILVGVVTFMIALTILGLSLFALSSYEGQFFVSSAAREQSLQDSESGMELVQALLAAPSARLEAAHLAEGQLGITHAMAYQRRSANWSDTTSSGPVQWDSTLVVVVSAKRAGVERTLLACFQPTPEQNPYQSLLAAAAGIIRNTEKSSSPSTLQLTGRVWQPVASAADTAWVDQVTWLSGRPIQRGTPPIPLADAFVSAHALGAVDPSTDGSFGSTSSGSGSTSYRLTLSGVPSTPTFFATPSVKPADASESSLAQFGRYEFVIGADLTIEVGGLAVWVAPGGLYFKDQVIVKPKDVAIPSTLVIVARASGLDAAHPNRAIWFDGGLSVPASNVHVFLVSQEDITLIQHNDDNLAHDALTVSAVAGGSIEIGGPQSSKTLRLGRDPVMDTIAGQLLIQGALPPIPAATEARFALLRPSWSEVTNP